MEKMTCSQLLDRILERPPLYLGKESVILAQAFISGFRYAQMLDGGGDEDALYDGFTSWVAERFDLPQTHSWSSMISFRGISEAASFRLLVELWDEYKSASVHEENTVAR